MKASEERTEALVSTETAGVGARESTMGSGEGTMRAGGARRRLSPSSVECSEYVLVMSPSGIRFRRILGFVLLHESEVGRGRAGSRERCEGYRLADGSLRVSFSNKGRGDVEASALLVINLRGVAGRDD